MRPRRRADDRLTPLDHASAVGAAATGRNSLVQFTWIYDRPVNIAGLDDFHNRLGLGLLGRSIERSAFPFARDRWVSRPSASRLDIDAPRARADIGRWIDERAAMPVDPWRGAGWHLGVLPLDDGGTAISLVASHSLVDGLGAAQAIADAASGRIRDLGYRAPHSRGVVRGFLDDGWVTLRGVPPAVRVLASAVGQARNRLNANGSSKTADRTRTVTDPAVASEQTGAGTTVTVSVDEVARQAANRGGTTTTLLCGVAVRLAAAVGWVSSSTGAVTVALSVSERTSADDARANALTEVEIDVDPTASTADLSCLRGDIRSALKVMADNPHEYDRLLPLTPFIPKKVLGAFIEAPVDMSRPVTTCAGLGSLDPAIFCPDGTPADSGWFQLAWGAVPGHTPLPRRDYLYFVWSGTEQEFTVFAATNLPLPESATWNDMLRAALAEFDVSGRQPTESRHSQR